MKKINIKKLIISICWFFILLYPFNCTISSKIYINSMILLGSLVIPTFLLFFMNDLSKIKKYQLIIFAFLIIFLLIIFVNNFYLKEAREFLCIIYILYLILLFILTYNNKLIVESFKKVLIIFLLEHIIATFFVQIFHTFYVDNIIPWITLNGTEADIYTLYNQAESGYNAGLTSHYSTNGIYLAIACIFFFSKYIDKHKKKDILLTILSFIAVLLTAKRAHLLFSIVSCLSIYIFNKKVKASKKFVKLTTGIIIIVIGLTIASSFIPDLLKVVDRFSDSDILNGRSELYEICIDKWNEHLLVGNGWGYFSYYYNLFLYNGTNFYNFKYIDAHNVFLQLLCEVGLVGFTFIIGCMSYIFIQTKKIFSMNLGFIYNFCFGYQIFFFLYCLTGNPLYDVQCYSIYFIVTGIILGKVIELKAKSKSDNFNNILMKEEIEDGKY